MWYYVLVVTQMGESVDVLGPFETAEERDQKAREHADLVCDFEPGFDYLHRLDVGRAAGVAAAAVVDEEELELDEDDYLEEAL